MSRFLSRENTGSRDSNNLKSLHRIRPSANSLVLFLPGLSGLSRECEELPKADIPELKNLTRFLSRAQAEKVAIHEWHTGLASLFGLEKLPVAALRCRRHAKSSAEKTFCLCADPVYIQPDLNGAVLLAHEELDLSLNEARELAAAIDDHFAGESWSLDVLTPHRWLLRLARPAKLDTTPLARVQGKAVGNDLPRGEDSGYWQRIQNEIQMLLHAHPLNAAREAQGRMPVNSLWLWGGGGLPEKPAAGWQSLLGRGEPLSDLADWAACRFIDTAPGAWPEADELALPALLAGDALLPAVQARDPQVWLGMLEVIDQHWICEAMNLLQAGRLDAVALLSDGRYFLLQRKGLRRRYWNWCWNWRRRSNPFSFFAQ